MMNELHKKITIGYVWSLIANWLNRLIGFVSTLILVRVLSPEDFGVVALASTVLAFFALISDAGTGKYVIKAKVLTNEMLNSAWSLNISLKCLCCLVIALVAKPLTDFMQSAELYGILLIFCLIPLINAFKNIGLSIYEKELNFKPLTRLFISTKLIVFPITIFVALVVKNYWALVVGLVVSEILICIGSYRIHPFRPKWSTVGWKEQWSFSKWHLISMTTGYIRSRIDTFILGRYLSNNEIGFYRIGQEFAWLPFTEVIAPATKAMYSGLSQISDDKNAFHQSILRYLTYSYLLVIPSIMAIYQFDEEFTLLLLGEKWIKAAPIIGMLALLMLSMPLNICLQNILTCLSKVRYLIYIDIIMISFIISIIFSLAQKEIFNLNDYLSFRIYLVSFFTISLCLLYKLLIALPISKIFITIFIPTIPSVITIYIVELVQNHIESFNVFIFLCLFILGIVVYSSLIAIVAMLAKNRIEEYGFIIPILKRFRLIMQNG